MSSLFLAGEFTRDWEKNPIAAAEKLGIDNKNVRTDLWGISIIGRYEILCSNFKDFEELIELKISVFFADIDPTRKRHILDILEAKIIDKEDPDKSLKRRKGTRIKI